MAARNVTLDRSSSAGHYEPVPRRFLALVLAWLVTGLAIAGISVYQEILYNRGSVPSTAVENVFLGVVFLFLALGLTTVVWP